MPYTLDITTERRYVRVEASGYRRAATAAFEITRAMIKIASTCIGSGHSRVLIISRITGELPLEIAETFSVRMRKFGLGKNIKVALVNTKLEKDPVYEAAENIPDHANGFFRVFDNEKEALDWLLEQPGFTRARHS